MNLSDLEFFQAQIEESLDNYLPGTSVVPERLHEAMRYSVCGGGKRLRGVLLLLSCEVAGGHWQGALPAAAALEMVHAYSLIHDDLPCMDDDDLRRGKPTNHRVYGEATALLAGDALLTQAMITMLDQAPDGLEKAYHQALRELVRASGTAGMIGGQVLDLAAEGKSLKLHELKEIYRRKTGALITAAVRMGGIIAAATPAVMEALTAYGEALGLAFQITDDLLDLQAETVVLGKTVGSDLKNQKATYPGIVGIDQAYHFAIEEINRACQVLLPLAEKGEILRHMAAAVLHRDR